jgi:hypothetical protein
MLGAEDFQAEYKGGEQHAVTPMYVFLLVRHEQTCKATLGEIHSDDNATRLSRGYAGSRCVSTATVGGSAGGVQ